MYASLLNPPTTLFGSFERLRRELDDVFGASGHCGAKVISSYNACRSDGPNVGLLTNSWV